jgi:nucleotide-binding universal stress UspA family protein
VIGEGSRQTTDGAQRGIRHARRVILIGYDGSEDAKAAIRQMGALVSGQPAIVLTAWEPFSQLLARTPSIAAVASPAEIADSDGAARTGAQQTADEGAALARSCGLDATPRPAERRDTVANTILCAADRANAAAIAVGSRGLGGLGSLFLGSVSHGILQHGDRPVVVVPSPKVAHRRNEKLRQLHSATA